MVEVQQKAFPAIEEAETEDVVVDKRELWAKHDVDQVETAMTFLGGDCLGSG